MNLWLQEFAYRIELNAATFIFGSIITLIIGLGTASFQAIGAALMNPIDALRNE
jgi:putative ABC transport system permease protein